MSGDSFTQVKGDTVAFGKSGGGFITYASNDKYAGYRMTFRSKIDPSAADANQRILLRASVADNDLMNGYFILLYKNNWQLFRKPVNSTATYGYMVNAKAYTVEEVGSENLYDNKYHTFVICSLCLREFGFFVRVGTVWIDIHDGCFGHGADDVVGHGALHAFVQFLHGIAEVGCLYEYVGRCLLFRAALFIEGDESKLALEPAV